MHSSLNRKLKQCKYFSELGKSKQSYLLKYNPRRCLYSGIIAPMVAASVVSTFVFNLSEFLHKSRTTR